jgi:hypothetical protein
MSALSRRSLVASAAALPALAIPAIANAIPGSDPVFAAIAAHREAYVKRMRTSRIQMGLQAQVEVKAHSLGLFFAGAQGHIGECITASSGYCVVCAEREAKAAEDSAYEIYQRATDDLSEIVPTTMGGAIALLRYLEEYQEQVIELPEEPQDWHSGDEGGLFEETYEHPSLRDKFNGEPLQLPFVYWVMQNVREGLQSLMAVQS